MNQPAMKSPSRSPRGFTFVEVLAAMLFMAIVIPVTVEGLTIANRAGLVAQRKRVAAQLADSLLTEMVAMGQWRSGDQSGDFAADHPGYRWVLKTTTWTEEPMRQVSLQVFFKVQEKEYEVCLTTLVDGSAS